MLLLSLTMQSPK
uniref:Uncharacterized protein n=1 Tax=Moniliophthora roreri TaxID=221103 RepID=A0A0W0FI10_MONRR